MAEVLPELSNVVKQKGKNSATRYTNRYKNMEKPWSTECQNMLVKNPNADGEYVQLKTLNRISVVKMIKQNQELGKSPVRKIFKNVYIF